MIISNTIFTQGNLQVHSAHRQGRDNLRFSKTHITLDINNSSRRKNRKSSCFHPAQLEIDCNPTRTQLAQHEPPHLKPDFSIPISPGPVHATAPLAAGERRGSLTRRLSVFLHLEHHTKKAHSAEATVLPHKSSAVSSTLDPRPSDSGSWSERLNRCVVCRARWRRCCCKCFQVMCLCVSILACNRAHAER